MYFSILSTPFYLTCLNGAEFLKRPPLYDWLFPSLNMPMSIPYFLSPYISRETSDFEVTSTKSNIEYKIKNKTELTSHRRGSHLLCGTE